MEEAVISPTADVVLFDTGSIAAPLFHKGVRMEIRSATFAEVHAATSAYYQAHRARLESKHLGKFLCVLPQVGGVAIVRKSHIAITRAIERRYPGEQPITPLAITRIGNSTFA